MCAVGVAVRKKKVIKILLWLQMELWKVWFIASWCHLSERQFRLKTTSLKIKKQTSVALFCCMLAVELHCGLFRQQILINIRVQILNNKKDNISARFHFKLSLKYPWFLKCLPVTKFHFSLLSIVSVHIYRRRRPSASLINLIKRRYLTSWTENLFENVVTVVISTFSQNACHFAKQFLTFNNISSKF